ncbi:class I SAM-dependent methyltransferase [Nocardia gipuzkoensis]|uniref:class I SAM-dependent methyltransferase n=1 Tax=Nocardia gipuzkoensis TaxID=2749991 RepID=UPI00237E8CC0|nr:class I SAM-dependent methyltransferase [Nocardia gipuzkoensis]MDE1675330.1 class I SAM-dependent methyltransferase [Nocardia gipuzkoensis]
MMISTRGDQLDFDYERLVELSRESPLIWLELLEHRGERVLHAGCGSGVVTVRLAQKFSRVVGTDREHKLIEIATNRFSHPNVEYIHVSFTEFIDHAGFDLIFNYLTMHEVDDKEHGIMNMLRLLRPGGSVVIVDRVVDSRWRATIEHALLALREFPVDIWRIRIRALRLLRYRLECKRLRHVADKSHFSSEDFVKFYEHFFPGAQFVNRGSMMAMYWTNHLP